MKATTKIKFTELLSERCNEVPLVKIGEDSIRYDFFYALCLNEKLRPCNLHLEYPIHPSAFDKRANKDCKRKEKPQIDLVVDTSDSSLNIEFGLFRQNSVEKSNIDKTARTVKLLNDMIRIGLDSLFTKRRSFFICVADYKMLGHQLQSKIIGKFPSDYIITADLVSKQKEKKTCHFDDRFISVFNRLGISFESNIVFNEEIKANMIKRETRIIIWEIKKIGSH